MKINFKVILLFSFLFLSTVHLFSAPPPPGSVIPNQPTCKLNTALIADRAQKYLAASPSPSPFFQTASLPTTSYVVVIRVDFSDAGMNKTKSETETFIANLRQFYLENSYGQLSVSATVTNSVYRLPSSLASYAQGICSNYSDLVQDAISAVGSDLNFSNGAGGGNAFHHIMIYHAGGGAETANDSGCGTDNLWSVFAPTVSASAAKTEGVRQPLTKNGVLFNGATVVPETESSSIDPLGVICHEYGHQLGLPDLYKSPTQSVVGQWSLMDSGIYIGSPRGSNPSHLDAWSKQFLGFSAPQSYSVGDNAANINLDYAEKSRTSILRIPISEVSGINGALEYFLIERRGRVSETGKIYDDALPFGDLNNGYLVWHIDDSIASRESRLQANTVNSGSPNFGVDLVEANGNGVVSMTSGNSSDPFPGTKGKSLFASPASNAFNGQQSGITLSGFLTSTVVLKKAFASDKIEVIKTINYPNPGGPTYVQKAAAASQTVTTLVMHTSKPTQTMKLAIYNLAGALVRDVPEFLLRANATAIATEKFVYEYEWDGKDDSGNLVASGMYLYRFKADDSVTKSGKLVLIR